MTTLPLAWTLLTVSLCTAGSSQILVQEPVKVLYPEISSLENIECDCINSCDSVYWFRRTSLQHDLQFLGKCNTAERVTYGTGVERAQTRAVKKRGGLGLFFGREGPLRRHLQSQNPNLRSSPSAAVAQRRNLPMMAVTTWFCGRWLEPLQPWLWLSSAHCTTSVGFQRNAATTLRG
ncbi:unnamed protein product [Pleuronectes platessa]|uniref:Uncharacterized protein n=1 Tax=Pleuronectes platessa TaxID=8262 RepID=A0A9N7YFY1_PLEPL|nr:unnamed protein product [Pleuronectes platessa]